MIYCIIIFSFLFEASFSNIIPKDSLFTPLFLITSLVILFPYFKNKKINFIIVCIICGLFYDIVFCQSIFINTLSFGISGSLIVLAYNYINYNVYSSNFLNLIIIVFYRLISYLLLCIVDFISFNEVALLKGIYSSIIVNIIYGVFIYIIIALLSKIFRIEKAE